MDPAVACAADPASGTLMYNWSNICMHYFNVQWLVKVSNHRTLVNNYSGHVGIVWSYYPLRRCAASVRSATGFRGRPWPAWQNYIWLHRALDVQDCHKVQSPSNR